MTSMDFKGKKAVVTGAGSGIGRAIAEGLLKGGAQVIATNTQAALGWGKAHRRLRHYKVDFSDNEQTQLFLQYLASLRRLDIVVNNAGTHGLQPVEHIKDADWQRIMTVNCDVPMRLIRAASPRMKQQRRGKILNIASIAAGVSRPGLAAYSTSKSALVGLTRAAALDLAPEGILVNALCPGHTRTRMLTKLTDDQRESLRVNIPAGRFAEPQEIAYWALFLVSDLNTYITGQAINVGGGVMAH
ncbi:MAG: SDR family oxidoreductase [Candidatus Omnitrophica bacterium]|nr:SDR family oxidoreductase [Candidatus Omnitrophota bacterium]